MNGENASGEKTLRKSAVFWCNHICSINSGIYFSSSTYLECHHLFLAGEGNHPAGCDKTVISVCLLLLMTAIWMLICSVNPLCNVLFAITCALHCREHITLYTYAVPSICRQSAHLVMAKNIGIVAILLENATLLSENCWSCKCLDLTCLFVGLHRYSLPIPSAMFPL